MIKFQIIYQVRILLVVDKRSATSCLLPSYIILLLLSFVSHTYNYYFLWLSHTTIAHFLGGQSFGPVSVSSYSSIFEVFIVKIEYHLTYYICADFSLTQILTVGTTFASIYSGYTVVGIPNEVSPLSLVQFIFSSFIHHFAQTLYFSALSRHTSLDGRHFDGSHGYIHCFSDTSELH